MKKYKLGRFTQIIQREEGEDETGISVNKWVIRIIWTGLIFCAVAKIIQLAT